MHFEEIPMRCLALFTLSVVASTSSGAPLPKTDPSDSRAPSHIPVIATSLLAEPKATPPLVTVTHNYSLTHPEGPLKEILAGTRSPEPPQESIPPAVLLVGPLCNSGEYWEPVAITRTGARFTVEVEGWKDNRPRGANAIRRPAHLVLLTAFAGKLPTGDYELRLVWRELFDDGTHYSLKGVREGRVPFKVAAPTGTEKDRESPFTLAEKDVKPVPFGKDPRHWQRPDSTVVRLFPADQRRRTPKTDVPKTGVTLAGTFDYAKWKAAPPLNALPSLKAPAAGDPVYAAVLGPELKTREEVTLRSVTWEGRTVTLAIEVWRDSLERTRNVPFFPLLVAPLRLSATPKDGALLPPSGEYKVQVEWTFLHADAWNKPYTLRLYDETPPDWVAALRKNSTASFTIPE
jgi:hypothetical protein